MLQTIENVFSMWDATLTCLDESSSTFAGLKPFVNAVERLRDLRDEARANGQRQEQSSSGATQDKSALSDEMCRQALIVAHNAHAYAIESGNHELEALTDLSNHFLGKKADEVRANTVTALIANVVPFLAKMDSYPVDNQVMTNLADSVQAFRDAIGKPASKIAGRKTATRNLSDIRTDGQRLLKKTLDKLAINFEDSDPDFVSYYFDARVIRNIGRRHRKADGSAGVN